ncbi:ornithine decarboxylase-like [Impatiens glandulifera]|uniref:ornithine decarboxylase-like n=1 Tax=Impatiens glandulifera TaxID=253017 RepID=UPI001FB090E0|nr:ornithine decarboxylase-like [Impatiens glandulifera]
MVVANEVNCMPILASIGVNGKRVTELPKEIGIKDFMKSIIASDPDTKEKKEPFFVLDLGLVKSLMDKWTKNLPTVRPFYAVKCNPDPCFLAYMASLGSNFDCASQAEIELVISLGVSPDRIIFANPCKAESHIRYAAKVGVMRSTFDSVYEVEKMKKCFPGGQLLIRVKAPDDASAMSPLGAKYGALPDEVEPLLKAAQSAGIDVVGVSFHVGSGTTDYSAYHSAISVARGVFDTAAKLGLPKMRVLNIGGGFSAGPQFVNASDAVKFGIQTYFEDQEDDDDDDDSLEIIAEPGRYFAECPFTLAASVIGKRVRGDLREYYINDGIYGSLCCLLNKHSVLTFEPLALESDPDNIPTRSGSTTTHRSTVFGPTCDALDTLAKNYSLPEMEVGDWLLFPNRGAYSAACASNFNGFKAVGISTHLVYSNNHS